MEIRTLLKKLAGLSLVCVVLLAACINRELSGTGPVTESGLYRLTSSGMQHDYYVNLPAGYEYGKQDWPLLIALHGAGDSHAGWLEGGFQGEGLLKASANEAIMVIPNARLNVQGRRVWDVGTETDYIFFLDLLAELDTRISYDERQVFITGHSAGALMTHELGCRYGDRIRAIAPSAGSITTSIAPQCTGSVAVLQIQSEYDEIVPLTVVTDTRDLWVLYNGLDPNESTAGLSAECVDYAFGAQSYPVQWCLHDSVEHDGHAWWPNANGVIWEFFSALTVAELTRDAPPGGGNRQIADVLPMSLSLTVEFPQVLPKILRAGLFLYPAGSQPPISGAPLQILNSNVDLGSPRPGSQQRYDIPVKLPPADKLPQSYTLLLAVYVEGGSIPIPTPGVDLSVVYELSINAATTPVVIPEVLVLKAI